MGQSSPANDVNMKDLGNLINSKTMTPKVFHGRADESYKGWAKKVRAHCNANRLDSKDSCCGLSTRKSPSTSAT